jgi:site-specific recombinase XerD
MPRQRATTASPLKDRGAAAPRDQRKSSGGDAGRDAVLRDRRPDTGQTRTPAAARNHLRRIATKAGVRRRFAPHQLRHAHAVEMAREGVSLKVIQRQLGHLNLGVTSVYLDGIDTAEIIDTVHNRRPPMISASAGLMI